MTEPGKANLWKSWIRWVSMGFTLCIALSILLPVGFGIAARGLGNASALATLAQAFVPIATVTLFVTGVVGGIAWSSFVAPPLMAGHLRHLRWRDRPKKLHDRLAFAPMSPAVAAGAVAVLVPALVIGVSLTLGDGSEMNDFPFAAFLIWALSITAVLAAIGYPIRRIAQRRFRQTVADAGACFSCGYNLHGAIADACPECGEPIPEAPPSD